MPNTSDDIRRRIGDMAWRVTQEGATEPPFDNAYWDNAERGFYLDAINGNLLFTSDDKFDSGCGWPSFAAPASSEAVGYRDDRSHGMVRTEVRSTGSGAHLGHVFDDGPAPSGKRYCINSAALRFVPEAKGTAIVAGGCFWGVEAYFRRVPGVVDATAGYTGGSAASPTYEAVCSGTTGHAEAVRVRFDPERVTYRDILRHFFRLHNPTTVDRQGADVGSQYRSAIFALDATQREVAESLIRELTERGAYRDPIVTAVESSGPFWPAEDWHQDYLGQNPRGYCHVDLAAASRPLGA